MVTWSLIEVVIYPSSTEGFREITIDYFFYHRPNRSAWMPGRYGPTDHSSSFSDNDDDVWKGENGTIWTNGDEAGYSQ